MRGEEDEIIKIQSHMNSERFLKSLQRINSFLIFVIDTCNYYNFTKPGSQAFNTYQNMSQSTLRLLGTLIFYFIDVSPAEVYRIVQF